MCRPYGRRSSASFGHVTCSGYPQVFEMTVEIFGARFSQSASISGFDPSCAPSARSLDSPVRRPRSAARSKPVSRAVRGSRKAKPESQRDGWTKAPPGRRILGPAAEPLAERAGQTSVCPALVARALSRASRFMRRDGEMRMSAKSGDFRFVTPLPPAKPLRRFPCAPTTERR